MSKYTTSKSAGFSVVEALIVVLVLAVLGVAGWLVYTNHHQKKANPTTQASSVSSKSSDSKSLTKAHVDPYAGWKSYGSTLGGFSLKYPSTWGVTGFQGDNFVNSSQINGTENEVRMVSNSAQDQSARVNNFAVQLSIQPWPGTSTPYNTYGNGSITLLANNITLWQEKEHENFATGPSTNTCPYIDIGTDDTYTMKLPNGKYLQIIGSFCWAQGQSSTESYAQQVASPEWGDAINIIKSVNFN